MTRKTLRISPLLCGTLCFSGAFSGHANAQTQVTTAPSAVAESNAHPPIPVRFTLAKPGHVTLVVEDEKGNRVRNLVAATPFPASANVVWWDGRDESVRVPYIEGNTVGIHGIYRVGGRPVMPGKYRVRGLVRDALKLSYEFTVYPTVGTPPWRTGGRDSGSGAWLSDHNPPADTEFVPALPGINEEPRVYISATGAEAGYGLIWTDLDGRKIDGMRWIGGHWTGATYLARDAGNQSLPNVILYTGAGWWNDRNNQMPELRLNAITPLGAREVFKWVPPIEGPAKPAETEKVPAARISGLAARNGLLVAAEGISGKLLFIRVTPHPQKKSEFSGTLVATADSKDVRDLTFDSEGRLLILTAQGLRRFRVPHALTERLDLGAGESIIGAGLEDPQRLSLDAAGKIYVSDWGKSHQVKVFDTTGKRLRAVGSAGEPKTGPYQPGHMNRPNGMTVLPNGELWVAEDDFAPKRVSVWGADGNLLRDMIGPPAYGGGGWLDPQDKTRFYLFHGQGNQGGGMEFKLNWEQGRAQLSNIYLRQHGNPEFQQRLWGDGPDSPIFINGQRYLTNAFSSSPTSGTRYMSLWSLQNGIAVPVMAAGDTQALPPALVTQLGDLLSRYSMPSPKGGTPHLFVWSDSNGNGKMENAEFGITLLPSKLSAVAPTQDGALVVTMQNGVFRFAPGWEKDVPLYNLAAPQTLTQNFEMRTSSGNGQSVIGKDNWTVVTNGPIQGFQNGQQKWYYHNPWPGLHAGHRAPAKAEFPGQLMATTRLLGLPVTPRGGEVGEIWGINSDRGVMYLMTTDGLFVSQLGDLDPNEGWRYPQAVRGMDVSDANFIGETFWPTLGQSSDGNIYLVVGKEHSSIVRVDGLESVKRLPSQTIVVTPALLAQAEEFHHRVAEAEAAATLRKPLQVALRREKMTVDGDFADWKDAKWVEIEAATGTVRKGQKNPASVEAALSVSGDNLLVALRSHFLNVLSNEGRMPQELFKTGGGLDLMLSSDPDANPQRTAPVAGDKRLILARSPDGKKLLATLFRPVVPGTSPQQRVPFSSPWRTITFDRVEDVSAQVQIAVKTAQETGTDGKPIRVEQIEASIPLALLEITPRAGLNLRGDIGILRGNNGETTQRLYWSNKATGLMNDVPGEAQLSPRSCGQWLFNPAP